MARFSRLMMNSATGALLLVVQMAIAFAFTPVIVGKLGNRDYGIWELLLGLVGYLGVLDLGVTPAVVRFVAHAEGRDDRADLGRVFNTCLVTMLAAGGVGILVMSLAAFWADPILGLDAGSGVHASLLFVLFGVSFFVNFVMAAFSAYLLGMQSHFAVNAVRIILTLVQYAGLWWVLLDDARWHDIELIALCVVVILVGIVEIFAFAFLVLKVDGRVRIDPAQFSWAFAREMFTFGAKNTVSMAASTLLSRGILFVVAHAVTVAAVAFYLIPWRLVSYASSAVAAIGFPMTPFFAAIAGRSGIEGQRAVWFPLTRALQFIGIGLQLAVLWLGVRFLDAWMGDEYAIKGQGAMYVLSAASLFSSLAPNGNRLLMSLGKHGRLAVLSGVFSLVAVVIGVPLSIYLGVTGAALAVAAFMIAQSIAETVLACRALQISTWHHLRVTLLRYLAPATICSAAFYFARLSMPGYSYFDLLKQGLLAGTVWIVAASLLGFTAEDRRMLTGWLRKRYAHP